MSRTGTSRVAIVGAASLLGKELYESLAESPLAASELVLLERESAAGQIASSGDDLTVIQPVGADSFEGADIVFFATPAETLSYWKAAREAGASVVDMTGALDAESGVVVRAPWLMIQESGPTDHDGGARRLNLETQAVVSAHPAAMMLATAGARVGQRFPIRALSATVYMPASEFGQAGMDELHQQTVGLLSFQNLPKEQFDAQTAFNLLPSVGDAAKADLDGVVSRIAREYTVLRGEVSDSLVLQGILAPVFHGAVVSMLIELAEPANILHVEAALRGGQMEVAVGEDAVPSNVSVAGQTQVQTRVSLAASAGSSPGEAGMSTRFWVWMAADNLKLAAMNAIACAGELQRLRPRGKVQ